MPKKEAEQYIASLDKAVKNLIASDNLLQTNNSAKTAYVRTNHDLTKDYLRLLRENQRLISALQDLKPKPITRIDARKLMREKIVKYYETISAFARHHDMNYDAVRQQLAGNTTLSNEILNLFGYHRGIFIHTSSRTLSFDE